MQDKYIKDITNAQIVAVYEAENYLEIRYAKEGREVSLVIWSHVYGGSMGYGQFFKAHMIPLNNGKKISERFRGMEKIVAIQSFKQGTLDGCGDQEELEIICLDADKKEHTFLVQGHIDFEEASHMTIKKRKSRWEKSPLGDRQLPKELYSAEIYKKVLAFALEAHREQLTPNGLPYAYHIVSVANEIIHSLGQHHISYDEANVAIACALLHDVVEDTDAMFHENSIDVPFMEMIVEGVQALSKDTTLPTKKEQIRKSLEQLKKMPNCIQMVKLADRISNLDPAPLFWNEKKRRAYVDEARKIHEALKCANPYLATKLTSKIKHYQVKGDDNYLAFYLNAGEIAFLVLDKSHLKYLETFKALDRLYRYTLKRYDLALFSSNYLQKQYYINSKTPIVYEGYRNYSLSWIEEKTAPIKSDAKIAEYMRCILEGKEAVV